MESREKIFGLLGLAARARKVASGGFMTEHSVKSGKSHMVLLSAEASDNTKKKFTKMCAHYKLPIYLFGTRDELGHSIGQESRICLSVDDAGFAKAIRERMNKDGGSLNESK